MQGLETVIVGSIIGGIVVAICIGLAKWGCPHVEYWRRNRAYAISLPESIEVGEKDFQISLQMKSPRRISRIKFSFIKSKTRGSAGGDIYKFKALIISDYTNLPYPSSIEVNSGLFEFTPFRLLNKGDKLIFKVTIDAKTQWDGRFQFFAIEDGGNKIYVRHPVKFI